VFTFAHNYILALVPKLEPPASQSCSKGNSFLPGQNVILSRWKAKNWPWNRHYPCLVLPVVPLRTKFANCTQVPRVVRHTGTGNFPQRRPWKQNAGNG